MAHENAIVRAWRDTVKAETTFTFTWFGNLIPFGLGAIGGVLVQPENASGLVTAVYGAVGGICGVLAASALLFVAFAYRAPYLQRNEARAETDRLRQELRELNTSRLQINFEDSDPYVKIEKAAPDARIVRIVRGSVGNYAEGTVVPESEFPQLQRLLEMGVVAYDDDPEVEWGRSYSVQIYNDSAQYVEDIQVQMTYRRTTLINGLATSDQDPGHLTPRHSNDVRFSLAPHTGRHVAFAGRMRFQRVTTVELLFADKQQQVQPGEYELHLIASGKNMSTPAEADIVMNLPLEGEPTVRLL